MEDSHFSINDRNLLIELKVTLDRAVTDIRDLKLGLAKRVDDLENRPPSPSEWQSHLKKGDDHETRIRTMEKFQENTMGIIYAVGALATVLGTALGVLIEHFFK